MLNRKIHCHFFSRIIYEKATFFLCSIYHQMIFNAIEIDLQHQALFQWVWNDSFYITTGWMIVEHILLQSPD